MRQQFVIPPFICSMRKTICTSFGQKVILMTLLMYYFIQFVCQVSLIHHDSYVKIPKSVIFYLFSATTTAVTMKKFTRNSLRLPI